MKPNRIERFLGFKEKTKVYMDTDREYEVNDATVYIDQKGCKLWPNDPITKAIDRYQLILKFNEYFVPIKKQDVATGSIFHEIAESVRNPKNDKQ